jgi:phosphinothricin acetyltransferase
MNIIIRNHTENDYPQVKEIYQQGMDTKNASFELVAPEWEYWDNKFLKDFRLVAVDGDKVLGWIALMPISPRKVFEGVCEESVYIHKDYFGKGISKQLMEAMIKLSEGNNIWMMQAGIFPENIASIKLHKKYGFREVGYREKIGKMEGIWRNVVLFERRSKKIY